MRRLLGGVFIGFALFVLVGFTLSSKAERTLEAMMGSVGKIVLIPFSGTAAPALSGSNEARLYYDTSGNVMKLSKNGGAYATFGAAGAGSGDASTSDPLSQFAATTSAELAGVISNETGSGALVFATSPTLVTPILGTPTSGVLTNTTGYTVANLAGAGVGVLTALATPSSANFAAALTDETGTGAAVFANTPTLVTPVLGVATATSINKIAVTAPATGATLTIVDGATALLRGTGSTTSSATPTINTDLVSFYILTAQAADITSFTTNLSGTPVAGQTLWIAIIGTAARAITWGASFEASTVALPTTTVSTTRLDVGFIWSVATSKWRCVAVS